MLAGVGGGVASDDGFVVMAKFVGFDLAGHG
jgi:hypothetical protein